MVMLISCGHKTKAWDTMNDVENLMNSRPDSAKTILSSIEKVNLGDDEEKARYALLMSMALDKNYIDTTSFDVLQPAIDYYLDNGTADERLRTLYYQVSIFMNKLDFDMAMQSFLKASDFRNECRDTLTYANMLVAQSILNYYSYQMEDYVSNNLIAADLYDNLNNDCYRQSSLIKALDGSIALGNRQLSDSILNVVDSLSVIVPESKEEIALVRQTYLITYEPNNVVAAMLDTISDYALFDDASKLNIATGFHKLHQYKKAYDIFNLIDSSSEHVKSLRYLRLRPEILEANGKYKEALIAYKMYFDVIDKEKSKIYYQKTTVAQELHELKVNNLYSLQKKDTQIWLGSCLVLVLIIFIGIIYYQLRLGKKNRIITEQEKSRLKLENENLQKHNSVLELEKHNAQLECEKQNLTADNMQLRILQLEAESEHLKELLNAAELSKPILHSIQERIGILNGLLAAKISDNDTYSKPYDKWINQVTEDRKSFMDSTRLAFRASHPAFMKYLDDHGLTESELNYVCLYAIGLRGKEIGEYIQIKRHYHTSTDIRKKLGLSEDDTNLGLHIRNLMKNL
jgi:hypothetical protein